MASTRELRQKAMRTLVREQKVKTQGELVALLAAQGFEVTQATVSRDIGDLDLRKEASGCYVLPEDMRLRLLVQASVRETKRAGNQVLLLCDPGAAPSVAAALDAARLCNVLGSIAGDDTVLAIVQDETAGKEFQASMDKLLQEK